MKKKNEEGGGSYNTDMPCILFVYDKLHTPHKHRESLTYQVKKTKRNEKKHVERFGGCAGLHACTSVCLRRRGGKKKKKKEEKTVEKRERHEKGASKCNIRVGLRYPRYCIGWMGRWRVHVPVYAYVYIYIYIYIHICVRVGACLCVRK